jgi:lipopolysaccharide export system permease protein
MQEMGFTTETNSGLKMSIEKIENNQLVYKINSDMATWNDSTQTWKIENYTIRTFSDGKESFKRGALLDTSINYTPEKLGLKTYSKEEMTTPELKAYMKELKAAGQHDIVFYELELYRRTGSAVSLIILTIIGYSLASRKVRGGLGLHIVSAVVLGALFELTSKFSTTFTTNAGLDAFWGIWIPNFIYLGIALIFIRFAQK